MNRPGFFFCICPDGKILRRQVDKLLRTYADASWERHVFWGNDEELTGKFWELLTLQGLFSRHKVLIVRNADKLPADTWKKLSAALGRPNDQAWPILCLEKEWEKGKAKIPASIEKLPCYAFAVKRKWIWQYAGLNSSTIRAYIQTGAKELSLSILPETLDILCANLPLDAWAIDSELAKFALLAEGRPLAPKDVEVVQPVTFNIFQFLQDLREGNADKVWKEILVKEQQGDDILFLLLSLLQRETVQLWQLLVGEKPWVHPAERTGKEKLARQLKLSGLAKLWDAIHTAEYSVKSGENTPSQALNALTAEMMRLLPPKR